MSKLLDWKDAPAGCTHQLAEGVYYTISPWLKVVGDRVHYWDHNQWVAYLITATESSWSDHLKPSKWVAIPAEFSGQITTTGIAACRDAVKNGFRVQCLQCFGLWQDISDPIFNCEDSAYRVHPNDVPGYIAWYNGQHLAPIAPPAPESKARPHADLIKAWADGAEIEVWCHITDTWRLCPTPVFGPALNYRIKPEPVSHPVSKISAVVFQKAASRRDRKYYARIDKLHGEKRKLDAAIAALRLHYDGKAARARAFAKEHVE